MPEPTDSEKRILRGVLAEQGLDDNGATPHGWRCDHPDRYPGYCTCVSDMVAAIIAAGFRHVGAPDA